MRLPIAPQDRHSRVNNMCTVLPQYTRSNPSKSPICIRSEAASDLSRTHARAHVRADVSYRIVFYSIASVNERRELPRKRSPINYTKLQKHAKLRSDVMERARCDGSGPVSFESDGFRGPDR